MQNTHLLYFSSTLARIFLCS